MKFKAFSMTALAVSVAALVTACGGGGGGSTPAGVQLSGVAATGLALANSAVSVKCASGTGSATTNESGSYTVTITDGALPCLVKVTGTADGAEVTLHSVAEAGTANGSTTTATANVTPLTEMILAQLAGTVPTSLFDSFGSGTTITAAQLTAATTAVLTALKDATGIDLGTTDPFKAALVPATATTAGNAYDDALEALKAKVPLESLPLIVTQIASTAGTTGSTAPLTLADVMAGVNAGASATCPSVMSGKYRVIEYAGFMQEIQIDFSRNVVNDGTGDIPFAAGANPCEFAIAADGGGTPAANIAFGPSGVGVLRDEGTIAYIVPLQAHPLSAFTGEWDYIESGIREDDEPVHFLGKFTFDASGAGTECGYRDEDTGVLSATCEVDTDKPSITATSNGGAALAYGNTPGVMYGYRAPNGSFYVFGSTDPTGAENSGTMRTHFILHKLAPWTAPAVGSVLKYWDFAMETALLNPTFRADQVTVNSASGDTVQRTRQSDGRVDTYSLNSPLSGVRTRTAPSPVQHQLQLAGLGMTVSFNGAGAPHLYAVSPSRR